MLITALIGAAIGGTIAALAVSCVALVREARIHAASAEHYRDQLECTRRVAADDKPAQENPATIE